MLPKSESYTVACTGSFNPGIFHPLWFQKHELVSEPEAQAAIDQKTIVMLDDLTLVRLGPYEIRVQPGRFDVVADGASALPARDLVKNVLTLLSHTPITALGVNWAGHHAATSEKDWTAVVSRWKAHVGGEDVVPSRLAWRLSGTMPKGALILLLEESLREKAGVWLSTNDHVAVTSAREAAKLLADCYDQCNERSATLRTELLS